MVSSLLVLPVPRCCLAQIIYTKVCGKVLAYQLGSTDAFGTIYHREISIDFNYVDGVSLTHDLNPREHIWTFAAAFNEFGGSMEDASSICECYLQSLLQRIISVILEHQVVTILVVVIDFLAHRFFGMEVGVVPIVPAAHSTTLHGSTGSFPPLPVMP